MESNINDTPVKATRLITMDSNTQIKPFSPQENKLELAGELAELLKTYVLLTPEAFVKRNFPEYSWDEINFPENPFKGLVIPDKQDGQREETMYNPLVKAFNSCIGARKKDKFPLRCFNVSQRRSLTDISGIEFSPDLFLTTQYSKRESKKGLKGPYLRNPGIVVEVKKSSHDDLGPQRVDGKTITVSENKINLLLQMHKYVSQGQWPSLPYRFIFSITITGNIMRLWKWSPTGCQVTAEIDYMTNPAVLVHFLRAVKVSNSRMGLEVGPGMLFEKLKVRTLVQAKKSAEASRQEGGAEESAPEVGTSSCRTKRRRSRKKSKTEEVSISTATKLVNRKIHIQTLYMGKSNNKEWENNLKYCTFWLFKHAEHLGGMVVFSNPIFKSQGMCSRSTRCYLSLSLSDFLSDEFDRLEDVKVLKKLRTIKSSWQDISRTHEGEFYKLVDKRCRSQQKVAPSAEVQPHLATVLASGDVLGAIQSDGMLKGEGVIASSPEPKEIHTRVLHWLVFGQVGYSLTSFPSTTCLLEALVSALKAHKVCFDQGILHRDVSVSNILLDITDSTGFLIDLDMAKDLNDVTGPQRPSRTGTLLFMSAILGKKMLKHRPWYDLESLFWILVFLILRHVGGITFDGVPVRDSRKRRVAMDAVFNQNAASEDLIQVLSRSKKDFLTTKPKLRIPEDDALDFAYKRMRELFSSVYCAFDAIDDMDAITDELNKIRDPNFTPALPEYPECSDEKDLLNIMSSVLKESGTLMREIKTQNPLRIDKFFEMEYNRAVSAMEATMASLIFPTHENIHNALYEAIRRASSSTKDSAAIAYVPPEEAKPKPIVGLHATPLAAAMGSHSSKRKTMDQEEPILNKGVDISERPQKKPKTEKFARSRK